ncbi:MAG: EI24 domain-containing protein [Epsilonproteobacteria bacterium]|nr:EI24 domain-containing protein [Campylobacterota bacterium]
MYRTIQKTTQDILSPKVLAFILKIGFASITLWIAILWIFWDSFENFVTSYLTWIPWEWMQESVAYIAAPLVGYMLIIITISVLTSLYSEKLLIALAKKHYPNQMAQESVSIAGSIAVTIKSTVVFLLLFILLLPLIFIPILGQVVMLYLWSILLKEPTVHDVGGLFISDKKILKTKSKKSTLIAMLASLFNYIPLLNIFAPIFAQILFLHHILEQHS